MLDNTGFLVGKFSYWVRGIQCLKSKDSFSKIELEKKLHFSLTNMGKIANSIFSIWVKWQFGYFRASKNNPNCKFHFVNLGRMKIWTFQGIKNSFKWYFWTSKSGKIFCFWLAFEINRKKLTVSIWTVFKIYLWSLLI